MVATAPTACGIETGEQVNFIDDCPSELVATAPTACGIETYNEFGTILCC